ncbi:Mu transposase C-terminal domain-containing protein [Streptomyces sp. CoT10]|uniref:Mu transposase C-terminal domain-containing protein n=1 Tax=Streptomyces sp. CoT10 TaxID=2875762 RepID=UPI0027E04C7B|nr:Mu transposase C-terminal domain-containing protein [Streptomyces sp. CoT10]
MGAWMTGQAGIQVRVRFMPHHDHRIEVYHAATGRYLGPADLGDQATGEQISAIGGTGHPRRPSEEGLGGLPARALRRREPARGPPAARRAARGP